MMATHTGISEFFVVGGTMHPDSPSYVERAADDELFELALAGEFCYVLTPRQMGKSSLMIRTVHSLRSLGVRSAIIDLTMMGASSMDTWYLDLVTELSDALDLSVDAEVWWQAHAHLGQVRRFANFLRDVVLMEIENKVVIFIDEIDTTLNLDFSDDFFAAIRAMYNARAKEPRFERLTFVLLGVATPSDLVEDQTRTPFNIGQAIELQEFSWANAQVLQSGWAGLDLTQRKSIMERVFHWTNGHPYLTQKLCAAVAENQDVRWTDERVDELVETLFLSEETRKESNLKFVRDRILTHPRSRQLLALYRKVHNRNVGSDERSVLQNWLKLSGLVKTENGYLRVRNEIYRHVFDLAWVGENTPINWPPIVAAIAVFVALGSVLYAILRNPNVCVPGKWCYPEGGNLRDKTVFALASCGDGTFFAGTGDAIYRRALNDGEWEQEKVLEEDRGVAELAVDTDCENVYAAVLGGGVLVRRADSSWSAVAEPGMADTWTIILLGDKILAGGDFGIRYLATNEASSWTRIDVPFEGIVQHMAYEDGRLYAAVWGNGIWHTDASTLGHWQPVGQTDEIEYAQRVDAADDGMPRLADTNDGLYWWSGSEWEKASEPWGNARTFCFVECKDTVFVGQENNGVLRSRDSGETWKPINLGWERPEQVRNLLIRTDEGGHRWLFAGTSQGIWRYRLPGRRASPTSGSATPEAQPTQTHTRTPTVLTTDTPTRVDTVEAKPTPTPTSTDTPTPTPTSKPVPTLTRRPTPTSLSSPPPLPVRPELAAPALGSLQANPIALQWIGELGAGQGYQVTAYHTESGYTIQSDLLTVQTWTVDLPAERFGEWRWHVSVVSDGSSLATSSEGMFWFNPHPGGGNDNGDTVPTPPR
jgi:hypothetical protein